MAEATEATEEAKCEAWRLERLIDLGFSKNQANGLVRFDVDWHWAQKVLAAAGGDVRAAYFFLMP